MSRLFSPLKIRSIEFKNRIFVSPMCQYSSRDGMPNDWHFVHLGSRAAGGAALVMAEATAVCPEGRITAQDSGLWSREHAEGFKKITRFIREQNAVPAIQLAHAGRKASTLPPWEGDRAVPADEGGWTPLAPSAVPFKDGDAPPREMSTDDIARTVGQFTSALRLALEAGFQTAELHFAHGYLGHEFLSPLSNRRTDAYGGSRENRMRFAIEVAEAARGVWPDELPLFARISATDWAEGGWDLPDSVVLSKELKKRGVDLIDCSGGGLLPNVTIPAKPGYQVPFAETIRKEAAVATGAVGLITTPEQAEEIIAKGRADAVLLARAFLRDPYWPLHAARALGADIPWPKQYARAN